MAFAIYSTNGPTGSTPSVLIYTAQGSVILVGAIVVFLDTVFTVIFLKYIHQQRQLAERDRKLYTISKYSVIGTIFSFCAVAMYAVGFTLRSTFTIWVLIRMKQKLYRIVEEKRDRHSSLQRRMSMPVNVKDFTLEDRESLASWKDRRISLQSNTLYAMSPKLEVDEQVRNSLNVTAERGRRLSIVKESSNSIE
ncbi:hypothetical protein BCR33DRAFT_714212 [Rhizoclosmatium globosum]|uniref:Uncharacterized protein n=1 Tax=Rhizoclosmatium globosum TaxID=329046 RepID=A0A1Y2CQ71_9FUNG|nr:hypothetical protein BCR33DRAFT_714212 [Rhizoclosmatium globosum]|eukprot:ORY49181.1 hypothetical protein BCR33DRAFT_714212 [Rhizoclosmatium globosum]